MPGVKPASAGRNQGEALRNAAAAQPVFRIKNGQGSRAVIGVEVTANVRR